VRTGLTSPAPFPQLVIQRFDPRDDRAGIEAHRALACRGGEALAKPVVLDQPADVGRQLAGCIGQQPTDFVLDDVRRAAGTHCCDRYAERARFEQHAAE